MASKSTAPGFEIRGGVWRSGGKEYGRFPAAYRAPVAARIRSRRRGGLAWSRVRAEMGEKESALK